MTTHLAYFENTYKFNDQAIIMASDKDESGPYLMLNQTIFYPQGGGQPSDQGMIKVEDLLIPIYRVKNMGDEVRHYTDQVYNHLIGQESTCLVDRDTRLLHAKLHSAGHLISNVIESLCPDYYAVKGHHFPGECYVEFNSKNGSLDEISIDLVNEEIDRVIRKNLNINTDQVSADKVIALFPNITYNIPNGQSIRMIRIGDFPFSPCGGTHVKSLQELQGLKITKLKNKKNIIKIQYDIKVL